MGNPEEVTGFENYTPELLYVLRGLFAYEQIDCRPIKYNNVIIWVDAEQRIHRNTYPAIERADGSSEYWTHGVKKI